MTSWWRWTVALLLCGVGVVLGPSPAAMAAPALDAGVGTVVADLGTATQDGKPGFSFDGAYYGYLVPSGDLCELHLWDVPARKAVDLEPAHVACNGSLVHWAHHADSLEWQVSAAVGEVTAYVWDASPGRVSVLAPDAHVFATTGVSADGRYLAFTGRSDSHPAPSVDDPKYAGYVYDRTTGVSLPLSKTDTHVQFVSWSPQGDNFAANAGGHRQGDLMFGGCFGTGTSCRVFPDIYTESSVRWSPDGTALLSSPGSTGGTRVYDFTDGSLSVVNDRVGFVDFAYWIGRDSERLLLQLASGQASVLDRATDKVTTVYAHNVAYASPTGRSLLFRGSAPDTWRYLDPSAPSEAGATFRGIDGYWTGTGAAFLGLGPVSTSEPGCSTSLRQWSPMTNTVSLFGPPALHSCYRLPDTLTAGTRSSPSGRFALFDQYATVGSGGIREYVVDLRRHVLLGPIQGTVQGFASTGSDLLAVRQPLGPGTARLLLVDPTPVPGVDDKPRWSTSTPANGTPIQAAVGGQIHVQLGASDLQQTPVNLSFRWRTTAGVPVASAPKGWSCERKRLAGGATVSDCTFAPPKDYTVRFLDLSATNDTTGAQSDTRSYLVRPTPTAAAHRH